MSFFMSFFGQCSPPTILSQPAKQYGDAPTLGQCCTSKFKVVEENKASDGVMAISVLAILQQPQVHTACHTLYV